jgi:hypothetical protein
MLVQMKMLVQNSFGTCCGGLFTYTRTWTPITTAQVIRARRVFLIYILRSIGGAKSLIEVNLSWQAIFLAIRVKDVI